MVFVPKGLYGLINCMCVSRVVLVILMYIIQKYFFIIFCLSSSINDVSRRLKILGLVSEELLGLNNL